jgi:hypothetical protein
VAYACPSCESAKTVVVLFGEEGSFPYPCLRCAWVPRWVPSEVGQRANAPCPTLGCDGSVCEVYRYDEGGELRQVRREPCAQCYGGGGRADRRGAGVPGARWRWGR